MPMTLDWWKGRIAFTNDMIYHMQGNLKDWHNGGNPNIQLNSLKKTLKASTWYQKLLTVNHLMPSGMYHML